MGSAAAWLSSSGVDVRFIRPAVDILSILTDLVLAFFCRCIAGQTLADSASGSVFPMRTADTRRRRLRHYRQPPAVSARVVVAGRTSTTSQKVHNLLCGLAAAASSKSDYVLCLDDDVTMHESALAELVAYKERYPASLLVTGYPHDSVSTQASLWTYCMMAYHLPLSIPFSLRDETQFVWGGCMLFEAEDLAPGCQIVQRSWEVGSEE